jgi:hypothetical protein
MAQYIHSRTIHTITIDVNDDVIGKIEEGDEVEIILSSRFGQTRSKMGYTGVQRLVFGQEPKRPPSDY